MGKITLGRFIIEASKSSERRIFHDSHTDESAARNFVVENEVAEDAVNPDDDDINDGAAAAAAVLDDEVEDDDEGEREVVECPCCCCS